MITITRRDVLVLAGRVGATGSLLPACGADDEDTAAPAQDAGADATLDAPAADTPADASNELPEYEYDGPLGPESLFEHGVASGDPLPDAVILWTRVSTGAADPVDVWWEVARDTEFALRVAVGTFTTDAERDFTVKVDATGLDAATTWYYRFMCLGRTSIVGRTRTAPAGPTDRLRFGVCSCSNFPFGYFHGYRAMAAMADLDAVLHLGDYIYEYGTGEYGSFRECEPPHEILTLDDYRARYSQYRRDPDLVAVHQQHPFIVIWDDHESADNSWRDGANNHSESSEGPWVDRRAAANRAYFEWLPIRESPDGKIWRALPYGDLVDILLLDTRLWARDEQATDTATRDDPDRTLLGEDQEAWVCEQLAGSVAKWRIVGQQVMVGQLTLGGSPINLDQWDGYPAARTRFFDCLARTAAGNVVILTGDIHSSWAVEITRDPHGDDYDPATGAGALAVEMVTPGITSPGFPEGIDALIEAQLASNPHIKFADVVRRGFLILDLTAERVQSDWFLYDDPEDPEDDVAFEHAFAVATDSNHLVAQDAPVPPRAGAPPLAPT